MKSPAPLFSFRPSGSFAKIFTALDQKRGSVVQLYHRPSRGATGAQALQRGKFFDAKTSWLSLTTEQKAEYDVLAIPRRITGYNYYLSLYMSGLLEITSEYGSAYYGLSRYGFLAGA